MKHILPVSISYKDTNNQIKKHMMTELNTKKGFKFDSVLSKNISFVPKKSTMKNNIYKNIERVFSMKIIWTYEKSESIACNFIDRCNLTNLILGKISQYAFKINSIGRIKLGSSIIKFMLIDINNKENFHKKNYDYSNIYHISDDPVYYKYQESIHNSDDDKIIIELPKNTQFDGSMILVNPENIKMPDKKINKSIDCDDGKHISFELTQNEKIELLYDPSPQGNVVYIDTLNQGVPASSLTINIECLTEIVGGYILWKKTYNSIVLDLLASSKEKNIDCSKLKKTIDGMNFEFTIIDCEPRNHYTVGQYYSPSTNIFYKEDYTKLKFNANYKKNDMSTHDTHVKNGITNTITVIICDNDGDDQVSELECRIRKTSDTKKTDNITLETLYDMVTHMHKPYTPEIKTDTLILDESLLCKDIIKSEIVWENKQYNFIIPQHNISLNLSLHKIVWKNNKNSLSNLDKIYIGNFNNESIKIKWIHDNDIYIVPIDNIYKEKTKIEITEWTDKNKIGGLDNIIWDLYRHLVILRNPMTIDVLKQNGLRPSKGVILYGPPGNGKTKVARCLGKLLGSREEHIILKSGTELISKWLGESEKNIAKLFEPAERSFAIFGSKAPLYTIIIDEIDIIAQERGSYADCTGVRDGMVNQLLTKIDGLIEKDNIILIGLTNREKILDPALLREGRLDRMIYIGLPDLESRINILKLYIYPWINPEIQSDKENCINILAEKTYNMSCADIQGYVSFVVKEYWSSLLGNSECRKFIPIKMFESMIYLKNLEIKYNLLKNQ